MCAGPWRRRPASAPSPPCPILAGCFDGVDSALPGLFRSIMDPWLLSLPASVDVTLFFATRPDGVAGREIERLTPRLKRAHRLKGRPIDLPRLHNSLASVHGTGTLTDNIRRAKAIGDRLWH